RNYPNPPHLLPGNPDKGTEVLNMDWSPFPINKTFQNPMHQFKIFRRWNVVFWAVRTTSFKLKAQAAIKPSEESHNLKS
ncbi:hypothetical protein Leryth_021745, partial [Lithospermum erythrorhizon]